MAEHGLPKVSYDTVIMWVSTRACAVSARAAEAPPGLSARALVWGDGREEDRQAHRAMRGMPPR